MSRPLIVKATIISMLLVPNVAFAQETPKVEVFGGYSFLHVNAEMHGWNASVAANLNKWFGLVVDVSGHYDSSKSTFFSPGFPPLFPPSTTVFNSSTNAHTILAGPRFTDRRHGKVSYFGHVLVGITRRHFDSEVDFGTGRSFSSFNVTGFAGVAGGGLDVSLNKRLSLRVVQAEYFFNSPSGFAQSGARVSTGLVVKF